MKILVYAPWDYDYASGGIMAMHKLADNIAELTGKQNAYIFAKTTPDNYRARLIDNENQLPKNWRDDTIVVQPEVINGNPLKAKWVIRYIVYTPGVFCNGHGGELCDENTYGEHDKYLMYDYMFKVKHTERIIGKLGAIEPFLNIYNHRNKGDRKNSCYLVRKGGYKKQDWHQPGSIQLDGLIGNFQRLSEIFNECHTFICYDEACFLTTQAALCGCMVVVVPKQGMTAEQWYNELPTHKYGQSYGMEGLLHAFETQPLLEPFVRSQVANAMEETKQFIHFCKNWITHG